MTTDPPQPAPAPPRKRRSLKRWITFALFLAASIWIGHFVRTRLTGEPTPRLDYWTRKIMAIDPPPPGAIGEDKANIMLSFDSVTGLLPTAAQWFPTAAGPANNHDLAPLFEDPEFQERRLQLREALEKGWPVGPHLPSLGYPNRRDSYEAWARHLAMHGQWVLEIQDDSLPMLENWRMMLQLARQLQRSRTSGAQYRVSTIQQLTGYRMISLRTADYPPIDTRELALAVDDITGPRLSIEELTRGDRYIDQLWLEHVYVREGRWLSVRTFVEWRLRSAGMKCSPWWNLTSPVFHDLDTARARTNAYHDELASNVTTLAAAKELSNPRSPFNPMMTPTLLDGNIGRDGRRHAEVEAYIAHLAGRCTLDAGLTVLALREYHRQHGSYPKLLEDLLPDFLPRLPVDDAHASGQPLRYRRTEDAQDYVLYSVGINGVDDGGQLAVFEHITGPRIRPIFLDGEHDDVFTVTDLPREAPR